MSRLIRTSRPFAHPIQSPHRDTAARLGRASEFRRREIEIIEKEGEVSTQQRGKTCVGSFARANIQHTQAEEADKREKARAWQHAGLKSEGKPKRGLSGIVECPVLLDLYPNYIDAYSTLRPHSELSCQWIQFLLVFRSSFIKELMEIN